MIVGGVIRGLTPGGLAEEIGLEPGDTVVSIDGAPVRDVIDYRFLLTSERSEVEIHRPDGQVLLADLEKHPDETLGVLFESDLFDGVRHCRNRCRFCFVDQLPPGLRPSLYVKDDDYRLSFLHGNYVTLTNLLPSDLDRIREQRLSPLYVSVHATDSAIRSRMLGRETEEDVMWLLSELGRAHARVHAQIVVCPGVNDGSVLDRTVDDLASLHPTVESIGVVPVGLTDHRPASDDIVPLSQSAAARLVEQVSAWQHRLHPELGTRLVFSADELYLLAEERLPPSGDYEGYPQLDNGVGSWRHFERAFKRRAGRSRLSNAIAATGTMAAPLLAGLIGQSRVVAVKNRFLGRRITVSTLMAGGDLATALKTAGLSAGERVLIPASALSGDGEFIDGTTPGWVEEQSGIRLEMITPRGECLFDALAAVDGSGL